MDNQNQDPQENKNTSKHEVPLPAENNQEQDISEEIRQRMADDPESLGVDLDGTNPGSNFHPMDLDGNIDRLDDDVDNISEDVAG